MCRGSLFEKLQAERAERAVKAEGDFGLTVHLYSISQSLCVTNTLGFYISEGWLFGWFDSLAFP